MGFDRAHDRIHCFACDFSADIIDLIMLDRNLRAREAFQWGYEHYHIPVDEISYFQTYRYLSNQNNSNNIHSDNLVNSKGQDFTAYFEKCVTRMEGSPGLAYLLNRGLRAETIQRFGIGFDPAFQQGGQSWQAIIIPTTQSSFVARNIDVQANDEKDKANRVRKRGPACPFNLGALSEDVPVFIALLPVRCRF